MIGTELASSLNSRREDLNDTYGSSKNLRGRSREDFDDTYGPPKIPVPNMLIQASNQEESKIDSQLIEKETKEEEIKGQEETA